MPIFRARISQQLAGLLVLLLLAPIAVAQSIRSTSTLVVMPFENRSKSVGAEWVNEACSEVLVQRMALPGLYVISRRERVFAFDRAGVPEGARPTRATVFRVAEQMGADFVVLGSYQVSETSFQAAAQLLEIKNLKLRPEIKVSGPLANFVDLQTSLAWQLLNEMSKPRITREEFMKAAPPIRLDAFENYVRGVVSSSNPQKVKYFKEALRLNPSYPEAAFELGKTYYDNHEYEQAIVWLNKVPTDDGSGGQAIFLRGMSEYNRGYLDRSYSAFSALLPRAPLTEVYNNLGVVDARRGRKAAATEYFSKAVAADPNDADYRFNLAVALFKNGDNQGAARQLRDEQRLRPSDAEAKAFLDGVSRGITAGSTAPAGSSAAATMRVPIERIKRNYNEASYRQIQMQIDNLKQQPAPK